MVNVNGDASFNKLLRAARIEGGMTQNELATRSMVSIRSIRNLESGQARAPRKQTVDLLADALQLDSEARRRFVSAATPPVTPHPADSPARFDGHLPHTSDPLIGREKIVDLAVRLLAGRESRWVSLTGIGGIGKTRVALAVAEVLAREHGRRIQWLNAADPAPAGPRRGRRLSPELSLAAVHGEEAAARQLEQLAGSAPVLLVVDDLDRGRIPERSLSRLLSGPGDISLLTCGRRSSGLEAGHEIALPPLTVPETTDAGDHDDYSAVALLRTYLHRLRPDVRVTDAQTVAMARLGRALDGIPLALKTASSWLPLYSPQELSQLAERSPFLLLEPVADDPGERTAEFIAQLSTAVRELPRDRLGILRELARLPHSWSVGVAAQTLRLPLPESARLINAFVRSGLVRPAQLAGGELGRFRVLNLVKSLITGERTGLAA